MLLFLKAYCFIRQVLVECASSCFRVLVTISKREKAYARSKGKAVRLNCVNVTSTARMLFSKRHATNHYKETIQCPINVSKRQVLYPLQTCKK